MKREEYPMKKWEALNRSLLVSMSRRSTKDDTFIGGDRGKVRYERASMMLKRFWLSSEITMTLEPIMRDFQRKMAESTSNSKID